MRCAVYCLVSRPDQLDRLVDRIKDAGVATRDISVVLTRGLAPMWCLWPWLWWPILWPFADFDRALAGRQEAGRVVSLAEYQARRGR